MHTTSDYEEAIQALTASIELDYTNAKTSLNRGIAYELINNMQQAIVDYSKVIKLFPKDAKAYSWDHD
jgi:Flp pilus assembly protein TadD